MSSNRSNLVCRGNPEIGIDLLQADAVVGLVLYTAPSADRDPHEDFKFLGVPARLPKDVDDLEIEQPERQFQVARL